MRFPEFKGEWEKCKLEECVVFLDGKRKPIKSSERVSEQKLYPYYGASGIIDYIDDYLFDGKFILLSEDGANILDRNYRVAFIAEGKIWVNNHAHVLQSNDNIDINFIAEKLESLDYSIYNTGTTMPKLNQEVCRNIPLWLPPTEEQVKIGTLLSLLNERITTQNKIIEKYESLIKGIGNKLFSFKMRFKTNDGNDFPSWKTKSFENIGKTFSGLSGKAKEDFGIGKPFIQYKQVFDSPQIQIQNCGLVNVSDSENQNNVKYGDVFFTVSSETPDEIGMSSVLLDEVDEMYLNSFCFGYRLSSFEVLNPLYASYFFRDSSFRNKVVKIAQGSTRYNISKSEFIKLKISLPCIEEQARIASFLSAVDEKIKEEKEILALYLIQKNHLLRQMVI